MRLLTRYIARQFLATFAITLVVFLFVMAIANVFRVIDLFSRGVPGLLILQVFSYGMPFSLIFAIPMSVLAAAFLVFSRMANDGELVAAKASGVSLWQLLQAPIGIAALLTLVCIYINCDLAPDSHFARRQVLGRLGVETPLSLLDEGRFLRDFPGYTLYIGRKEGTKVSDVVIYEFGDRGIKQTVRARSGTIAPDAADPRRLAIRLYQVRIDQADEDFPDDLGRTRHLSAAEYPLTIDVADLMTRGTIWKKRADLRFSEIVRILRGSLLFAPEDFLDPGAIVGGLSEPADLLTDFLQAHLSDTTLAWMDNYDGSPAVRAGFLAALSADLNRLLTGPPFYTPERFRAVRLDARTRSLLERHPEGEFRVKLHRMLLQDAYPGMLARHYLTESNPENVILDRTALMVEASTRLALSLACYAFVLLGAALGMKIHRRESLIGIAVTLVLVFVFYIFIMVADALVGHPHLHPQWIVWIPFVLSEAIALTLIRRAN